MNESRQPLVKDGAPIARLHIILGELAQVCQICLETDHVRAEADLDASCKSHKMPAIHTQCLCPVAEQPVAQIWHYMIRVPAVSG